jgi:hypothetical protein
MKGRGEGLNNEGFARTLTGSSLTQCGFLKAINCQPRTEVDKKHNPDGFRDHLITESSLLPNAFYGQY